MSSVLRSVLSLALVSATFALVTPGCSEQGQGERCDHDKNGDLDCESGLECIPGGLLVQSDTTGRCCPEPGTETDKRCARKVGGSAGTNSGGTSSAGTNSGGTSSGGTSSGGTSSGGTETSGGTAGTDAGGTPAVDAGAGGQAG